MTSVEQRTAVQHNDEDARLASLVYTVAEPYVRDDAPHGDAIRSSGATIVDVAA